MLNFKLGYQITKFCTLSVNFLPYCFSAQIVIQRPVANFAWLQKRIIGLIHNVMLDTQEVMWNFRRSIKQWYIPVVYCVSLISDIANCNFRP